MQRIEKALKEQIQVIWQSSLEGVISVAEGTYKPYCSCDPMTGNPRIQEFLIEGKIYTPRELQQAFLSKEEVSQNVSKATLNRMCNLFSALGDAAKNERPLYTKDRRELWDDKKFNGNYGGNISDAMIGFGDYLVAEREDFIQLFKLEDFDRCANKQLSYIMQEYIKEKTLSPRNLEYYENYKTNLAFRLEQERTIRQMFLDDDESVVENRLEGCTRHVGTLIYLGIDPAVDHLIMFYMHKIEEQKAEEHNH